MLASSKNVLFDDAFKLKLENPEMPAEQWMAHIDGRKCSFRVEKIVTAKRMAGTRYGYKVSTRDPLWPDCQAAVRQARDFFLLYTQLQKRFPNACVPKVGKREVDNLHLMELYLTEISMNPFFRMDVAFSDFLNGKMKDYKQTKKNDRKHSQGTLRWLQQTTEYKEFQVGDDFVKSIKGDFDQLERAQKTIINALAIEIKALNEFQLATQEFTTGLGDYLAMEQVSQHKHAGSTAGLPPGRLAERLTQLIGFNQNHLKGLQQAYDPGSLERLTVHPILIEMKMLAGLRKVLGIMSSAKNDYDKAKASFEGLPNEDSNKQKAMNNLGVKEVYFFKQRRAFGFELERFRTYRTVKFQTFMNQVVKFNLRGSHRITEEWSKSGLTLDPREEQEFFTMDKVYNQLAQNPVGRNRALSINQSTKNKNKSFMNINASDYKSLKVINNQGGGMGSKYLKLSKDEIVVGYQLESGDWSIKRGNGKHGLAKAANIAPYEQVNLPSNTAFHGKSLNSMIQQPNNPPSMPVAPNIPNQYLPGGDDDDEIDWSSDEEGGSPSARQASPPGMQGSFKPPAATGLPPAATGLPPAATGLPPMGMPVNQSARPPMGRMAAPQPPNGGPPKPMGGGFQLPPMNGAMGQPKPQPPMGNGNGNGFPNNGGNASFGPKPTAPSFGALGPKPTGPSFGPPNGGSARPPMGGPGGPPMGGMLGAGPKPPMGGGPKPPMGGGPKPPMGGGRKPPKNKAAKKKGKGKKPMGGPMGGGGLSFLADIKKGNAVSLNKVPEAEKSKEIGGAKGKGAAERGGKGGGGGGGGGFSGGGGGGGMLGELAAAVNKRR